VRRDLAPTADGFARFLDFDKGTDLGLVADRASVQVHQRRLEDVDILSKAKRLSAIGMAAPVVWDCS